MKLLHIRFDGAHFQCMVMSLALRTVICQVFVAFLLVPATIDSEATYSLFRLLFIAALPSLPTECVILLTGRTCRNTPLISELF